MKKLKHLVLALVLSGSSGGWLTVHAQAQPAAKKTLSLTLSYFNDNNRLQYLKAIAKTKIAGRFQPVADVDLRFYITADSPSNLLGKGHTNEKGEAVVFIPPSAKAEWMRSSKQSFVVVSEPRDSFDAATGNLDIAKARVRLDTAAGRNVNAVVEEQSGAAWTPVKGVDVKIAVKRMDGSLNIGDAPNYTTDSTGTASAVYKLDSTLPGDVNGNIVLVASVQDNDSYGNLSAERIVRWGVDTQYVSATGFDRRTLFARRGKSPWWLTTMAYSIIFVVWGILIYLIGQIIKLKRLGAEEGSAPGAEGRDAGRGSPSIS
jgi:hypothetical protein